MPPRPRIAELPTQAKPAWVGTRLLSMAARRQTSMSSLQEDLPVACPRQTETLPSALTYCERTSGVEAPRSSPVSLRLTVVPPNLRPFGELRSRTWYFSTAVSPGANEAR